MSGRLTITAVCLALATLTCANDAGFINSDEGGNALPQLRDRRSGYYPDQVQHGGQSYDLYVWRGRDPVGCNSKSGCTTELRRELPDALASNFDRCGFGVSEDSGRFNRSFTIYSSNKERKRYTIFTRAWSGDSYEGSGNASIRLNLSFTWLAKNAPSELRRKLCDFPRTGGRKWYRCNSTRTPRCTQSGTWDAGI
jgi:hypothetical protein